MVHNTQDLLYFRPAPAEARRVEMTLSPLGQVGKDFGQLLIVLLDNKNSNKTFPFSLFDSILNVFIRVLTLVRNQISNNLIDFL